MIGAVAAPVIGGIMGAGGTEGGTTTTTSAPWAAQQPYLQSGFEQAQNAYNSASGMGAYTGQRQAGLNDFQTQGYNLAGNYGLGQGYNSGTSQVNTGLQNLGQAGMYGQNAAGLFGQASAGDPSGYAQQFGNQYANSPYADGLVDAASRDVNRNLYENQLTGLQLGAVGAGGTNSTRAGVTEGIMQRGAADRIADTSSTIRGGLFNQGLTQGLSQYNTNLQNQLSANNQLYNAGTLGSGMVNSGNTNVYNGLDVAAKAGQGFQTQEQAMLAAQQAQFNEQRDVPMSLANQYLQMINGNYGSQGTTTAPNTGGGFQGAVGGAMSGLGIYKGLNDTGLFGGFGSGTGTVMNPNGTKTVTGAWGA